MAIGIAEKRHPEIVILHRRDPMGRARESDAAALEFANPVRDVGTAEVDRRTLFGLFGFLQFFKEPPHPAAIEECEIAEAEQFSQVQNIAIERLRTIDVAQADDDLCVSCAVWLPPPCGPIASRSLLTQRPYEWGAELGRE